jgi:hypothetical protein
MVLGSCLVNDFTAYYVLRPMTSVFLTAGQVCVDLSLRVLKEEY